MSPPLPLGPWQIAAASLLVVVAGAISVVLRLGVERRLALASVRTVVQLILIGYVLRWVFAVNRLDVFVALLAVMVFFAGHAAVQRSSRRYRGIHGETFITLALVGSATTFTVTALIIRVEPLWRPQYALPLLGMVLGNSLTGISLALDSLLEAFDERRDLIESDLSLGASKWEAARDPLAEGVRRGMIPIINTMMVVGVVSLPGMMTGQILAGADPVSAVKYQVVVMFMVAAATALGAMLTALFVYRRVFNDRHQLVAGLIERRATRS